MIQSGLKICNNESLFFYRSNDIDVVQLYEINLIVPCVDYYQLFIFLKIFRKSYIKTQNK